MSFATRLFRIARAQLGELARRRGKSVDPAAEVKVDGADSDDDWNTEEAANSAGSGRDPELAGYYANLELPYGADLDAVEAAWKRLMRQYHPDLHGTDPRRQQVATEIVQGLNMAYRGLREHLRGS